MKLDLWIIYGKIVIFISAILSFKYKIFGVIMILYIILIIWYYIDNYSNFSLINYLLKIYEELKK